MESSWSQSKRAVLLGKFEITSCQWREAPVCSLHDHRYMISCKVLSEARWNIVHPAG